MRYQAFSVEGNSCLDWGIFCGYEGNGERGLITFIFWSYSSVQQINPTQTLENLFVFNYFLV